MKHAKRAFFSLAASNLVRCRELDDRILAIAQPSPQEGWLKYDLHTDKWIAFPGKLRGRGIYAAARALGLSLAEIAQAFNS